jgi:hypothetical protein
MIVKKTKQLRNFKKGINLYVPRKRIVSAALSGISLTAPTIYGSGLTLDNSFLYMNGSMNNPYTLTSPGNWIDSTVGPGGGRVIYDGEWRFSVYALLFGYSPVAVIVARNTASPASLPTSGWVNDNDTFGTLVVTGTLVISTTP